MHGTDLFGYLASILVFGTFYMKRMLPLRLTAIASNVAFIGYAWANGLTPILVLHATLLPLNVLRLAQQRRQMAKARALEPSNQAARLAADHEAAAVDERLRQDRIGDGVDVAQRATGPINRRKRHFIGRVQAGVCPVDR